MQDVYGNSLQEGDKIAFIPQDGYTASLSLGFVTGFTPKKVRINVTNSAWMHSDATCLKFPNQVVRCFGSD